MSKIYVLVFLLIGIISKGVSQKTLNDYKYVIVSEQFEFQKEKDKYQLNSLTKFLFNKNGFNAFFNSKVPEQARRCDGLWAEAEGNSGMVYTTVEVLLKDCNGVEVYRSQKGKSKIKDFKKAYYEAMRKAFKSIENLHVNQSEIEDAALYIKPENKKLVSQNSSQKATIVAGSAGKLSQNENIKKEHASEILNPIKNLPISKYTNYTYVNKSFLLIKKASGYSLYQEVVSEDDDLLLVGKIAIVDEVLQFISKGNSKRNVRFDASKNLIIGEKPNQVVYTIDN